MRWRYHIQGPMPVKADELVQVQMGNGDILAAMPAGDIDWNFPGDPVVRYRLGSTAKPAAKQAVTETA